LDGSDERVTSQPVAVEWQETTESAQAIAHQCPADRRHVPGFRTAPPNRHAVVFDESDEVYSEVCKNPSDAEGIAKRLRRMFVYDR
jgi:hypothetical protein